MSPFVLQSWGVGDSSLPSPGGAALEQKLFGLGFGTKAVTYLENRVIDYPEMCAFASTVLKLLGFPLLNHTPTMDIE